MPISQTVQDILEKLPQQYRGPGGAVAVVKDGELVGEHVWGYSNLDKRTLLTPQTQIPICSISKQMVCGLLTDLERNPTPTMLATGKEPRELFWDELKRLLRPELMQDSGLELRHLCDNQSGIRDYWVLTVLWGARPEGRFSMAEHCPPTLERYKSFHFPPGTEHSYCNLNYSVLGQMMENVTQQPLDKLLTERIFGPAGMTTAKLGADTANLPLTCDGYEGSEKTGFFPAENRIEWAGDAGIVASLSDMVSYEKYIDRSQADPQSWYRVNIAPRDFKNGKPSDYRQGLAHASVGGVHFAGHGGALRGYRLHRRYAASERLSIVVLFNFEADAAGAATHIMKEILGISEPKPAVVTPVSDWVGYFLDRDTQIAVAVVEGPAPGELVITYRGYPDKVKLTRPNAIECEIMNATIDGDTISIQRPSDNRNILAQRIPKAEAALSGSGIQGDYHSADIDSVFHCSGQAGLLYGSFDGFLGQGPIHLMRCIGQDVWLLACPRSMDAKPPGDWTIVVQRNESGDVTGVTIGCWLGRKVEFVKTG